MTEKSLRQMHRRIGIPLVVFIVIQSATGIILAIEDVFDVEMDGMFYTLHTGFSIVGDIYRILLGAGLFYMAMTGFLIYLKIRARTKKTAQL